MFNQSKVIMLAASLFAAAAVLAASPAAIQGTVRGPDGKPLKGADVRLEPKTARGQTMTTKTDASGKYTFSNPGSGRFRVMVMSGTQTTASVDNLVAGKQADLEVKQQAGIASKPGKKGKHMVWVPADTGSHIGGRWVEVDDGSDAGVGSERVEKKSSDVVRKVNSQQANLHPGGGG